MHSTRRLRENRQKLIIIEVLLILTVLLISGLIWHGNNIKKNCQEADHLVVYTPHPIEFVKPLIEEFERRSGISVEVITGGTGQLEEQLENGQQIDVMWGGSYFSVSPYSDLFADYLSENEKYYLSVNQNKEGNMTRFTDVPSVLMVNTDLMGDIKIEGYDDLLQPELKGKIAFADPAKSSSSFEQLINMLYACGGGIPDKGWDYIHQLCSNLDGQLLDSSSEVYNGVAEGKYLVGLTFEEAAVTLLREGQHVKIIYMKEGVISTPDGIYLLKGAVHAEEAKEFIDFLTGYDAQYMITQRLGRRSVRIDLLQPNGLPAKKDIHILYANAKQVLESRDDWIAEFDRIFEEESR